MIVYLDTSVVLRVIMRHLREIMADDGDGQDKLDRIVRQIAGRHLAHDSLVRRAHVGFPEGVMRVVVTGASGFIGRNVLLRAPRDWDIVAIAHRTRGLEAFVADHQLSRVRVTRCGLTWPL